MEVEVREMINFEVSALPFGSQSTQAESCSVNHVTLSRHFIMWDPHNILMSLTRSMNRFHQVNYFGFIFMSFSSMCYSNSLYIQSTTQIFKNEEK